MAYIDHNDLTKMVKTLIDDVELLKRDNAALTKMVYSHANRISDIDARQYKGQDD